MLHDLANDDDFVALKWTSEDREGWRHRERTSKPAVQQKTTDDDDTVTRLVILNNIILQHKPLRHMPQTCTKITTFCHYQSKLHKFQLLNQKTETEAWR